MVTNYISSGDWKATDSDSILASKSYYVIKLRALFNLKFRYASVGQSYSPSLSFIIDKISFHENKEKRITLQKVVKIIESMPEVSNVVVDKRYDGRKIIDAILHIHPSPNFISNMIENNKVTKRAHNAFLDNGDLIIEPSENDFSSDYEYRKSKRVFDIQK